MIRTTKVYVIEKAKGHFLLRWNDPRSGKRKERRADGKTRQDAARQAGALEAELDAGRIVMTRHLSWTEFKERYFAEHVASLAPSTQGSIETTFRLVDQLLGLGHIGDLDASRVSVLQAELRKRGIAEATVKHHLVNVRTALNWAADLELIAKAPKIRMPRGIKGPKMKGGHVSEADFLRAVETVPEVVLPEAVASWQFFLRGMWQSGWRLSEALTLDWSSEDASRVDLANREFVVLGEHEKGRRNRRLPMIPEFYALASEVPEAERVGRVFKFAGPRGGVRDDKTISRTASRIFQRAGVYAVNGEKSRHATLHDLRRTFGKRMAERYPWPVLRLLMRHEDLKTTLDFYVGEDVESAKRLIWNGEDCPFFVGGDRGGSYKEALHRLTEVGEQNL